MITTIRLYGKLGAKFGRVFRLYLDTRSPAEAIRALSRQVPGFERELVTSRERGIGYSLFRGKENIGFDGLPKPVGPEDIRIAPVVLGAKRAGLMQVVIGAALIAGAFMTGGLTLVGAAGAAGSAGAAGATAAAGTAAAAGATAVAGTAAATTGFSFAALAGQMGISMALGGLVQMLSPQPKGLSALNSPDNGASYNFNGAINTRAQGNPVPLGYGRMTIGSAVISAGIYTEDQA